MATSASSVAVLVLLGLALLVGVYTENINLAVNTASSRSCSDEKTESEGSGVPRCTWSPKPLNSSYADTSCMSLLTKAILRDNSSGSKRWMFFGDSTMLRLFARSPMLSHFVNTNRIHQACKGEYQCKDSEHRRCGLPKAFGMKPRGNTTDDGWVPPNFELGEGPVAFGLKSHYCQDCSGCNSQYTLCTKTQESTNTTASCAAAAHHGAYFSVEFARDVEIQTPEYSTSQENIAAFIGSHINHDAAFNQEMGGLPVCLVTMGIHDILVPNTTVTKFANNMQWFLEALLQPQCSHILWLPNAAPLHRENEPRSFLQTLESIQEWNDAISNQVMPLLGVSASILDVFDASIGWPHDGKGGEDNVHMEDAWYHALGSFLVELSKNVIEVGRQEAERSVSLRSRERA